LVQQRLATEDWEGWIEAIWTRNGDIWADHPVGGEMKERMEERMEERKEEWEEWMRRVARSWERVGAEIEEIYSGIATGSFE
ncbi:hypothetical protein P7C71_g5948, partial [Lecanoromycetidae sp. Uapishka_2]